MNLLINPQDYGFHPSINYPEIHDFFGGNTFVKTIADSNNGKDHHYWYIAVKVPNKDSLIGDERYEIMSGSFSKNKIITERDWPRKVYLGLISTKEYGETLLKNLLGTTRTDSVDTHGADRLAMKCTYMSHK